jgi:hypothetical protein
LTGSQKWKFPPSNTPGRFGLILIFIAVAAAVPRLVLGTSQPLEYDGYWDVFVAVQDNWASFWSEAFAMAHPPLYFMVLKPFLYLGHSLLVYRSVSVLAGVAAVVQVGRIARKITGSNIRAYQSALAYGLALPGIIVSCEVRSYTLSVFFVLLSFTCLLDIPGSGNVRDEATARAGFAGGAVLAFLTHYFGFFYAGAAIVLLVGRFMVRWYKGAVRSWWAAAAAEAATILPVIAAMYTLYKVHASHLAPSQQAHLMSYYYDPNGNETVAAFLLRNWKNFVNLFFPYKISSDGVGLGVLILALIAGLVSAADLWRRSRHADGVKASWTNLITAMMLAGLVFAALAGKYPFGGDLRQQYLLFPFLVFCVAIGVERVARKMSGLVPAYSRLMLNALVIVAILWVSVVQFERYPKGGAKVLADQMEVFDRLEPAPSAVYLDQFNLITFFTFHDTWDWSSVRLSQPIPGVDLYRVHRGAEQILVFRDKTQWNFEPDDVAVYNKLAECLRAGNIRDLAVFSARQTPPKPPFSNLSRLRQTVVKLASDSSVCVQRLAVNQFGWYAAFRQSDCARVDVPPLQVTGMFDDVSDEIQYSGLWGHGSFPRAAGGTVSYSNDRGAVAQLLFEGGEIAYVYTKAFNRGVAEVKLDGVARGEIDLYSPKIIWQARKTFGDLAPGKHTFELIVTGRKDAAATDRYVDVDALIVR